MMFQCRKVTCRGVVLTFSELNQYSKKMFAKYGKYTELQTYFSETNIWHSSQTSKEYRSVLKCDRRWLFDCNQLPKYSSLSRIIRRSDFQAKILKEIHYNHSELYEYDIHALSISTAAERDSIERQYSTFCCQTKETNFLLFRKISTNTTVEFGNRCYFKGMNFYRPKIIMNLSDQAVTLIFGSDNQKLQDNLSFIMSISIDIFYGFEEYFF